MSPDVLHALQNADGCELLDPERAIDVHVLYGIDDWNQLLISASAMQHQQMPCQISCNHIEQWFVTILS